MRAIAAVCLLALPLAACQTIEERRAEIDRQDDARCVSYGAKRGTPAYTNCRLELDRNRAIEMEARRPRRRRHRSVLGPRHRHRGRLPFHAMGRKVLLTMRRAAGAAMES